MSMRAEFFEWKTKEAAREYQLWAAAYRAGLMRAERIVLDTHKRGSGESDDPRTWAGCDIECIAEEAASAIRDEANGVNLGVEVEEFVDDCRSLEVKP